MDITRRDFLKYGAATIVVGSGMEWLCEGEAQGAVRAPRVLRFEITDAVKQMATHNAIHDATCYFWIYRAMDPTGTVPIAELPPDCPGPVVFTTTGQVVTITLTNKLDAPHSFSIPRLGIFSGAIAPGATKTIRFTAKRAGTYLYYDNLNEPVNRMMGLHGAFIIMPETNRRALLKVRRPRGRKPPAITPFDEFKTPKNVQRLFTDLGTAPWWPGLKWQQGDPATDTPPFRQYVWLLHQASPRLFDAVGGNANISFTTVAGEPVSGPARDPVVFTKAFLHDRLDPAAPTGPDGHPANFQAQYFTISGQSGHFAHNNPFICPNSRVGEPVLIRILNAGLWLHSTHCHANHAFVLSRNNRFDQVFPGSQDNPIWIDLYTANPLDTYEWLFPYMKPPDVPNHLGIGRNDLENPLTVNGAVAMNGYGPLRADIPAARAVTTWPPLQELDAHIPRIGTVVAGGADIAVRLSPLCYPMHDHSEPSQVAHGGNYNMGLISGINFTGDRKGAKPGGAGVITFPMYPPEDGPDFRKKILPPTEPFVAPSHD